MTRLTTIAAGIIGFGLIYLILGLQSLARAAGRAEQVVRR